MRRRARKDDERSNPAGGAAGPEGAPKSLRFPRIRARDPRQRRRPDAGAGIERAALIDEPPPPGTVAISCIDYGPTRVEKHAVLDLDLFLARPRSEWCAVRWINVDGLHPYTIQRLRAAAPFHTLAAEDVLHVPQRCKVERYEDHLFLVAHMLEVEGEGLADDQVSFVFFKDTVITFQERPGDVWDPIRKRIDNPASRLRRGGAGYLLYALLDAIVDHLFPILETFGNELADVENRLLTRATTAELQDLYRAKRRLLLLRRMLWPMRQLADDLQRSDFEGISRSTREYLRDVHDHTLQVLDLVETYREMASGLTDLYMSSISNRMNEIMKVLTIMATLFIPVTFLAGVYGMNFEHFPELAWKWSYAVFWAVCLAVSGGLLAYFRRKGWIGA